MWAFYVVPIIMATIHCFPCRIQVLWWTSGADIFEFGPAFTESHWKPLLHPKKMINQFLRILKLQNCENRCESSLGQQRLLLIDLILHLLSRAAVAHATHNGQGCLIVAPRNFAAEERQKQVEIQGQKNGEICSTSGSHQKMPEPVRFKQQRHGI